ncbi:MAG TPA: MBOAT family O-acyltransferase [Candidatus Binatia bacterium]|nr:MBOAT family O-acyltransferase [Candidatus Binatia bacterium]
MLFTSLQFLIFLPAAAAVLFALPARWRNLYLLLLSYGFYAAWKPAYVLLLVLATAISYGSAIAIERASSPAARKAWVTASAIGNLGALFVFKYFNLFGQSGEALLRALGVQVQVPELSLLLPVGISFYTFQSLGYTIDVYRGVRPAERDVVRYALFVSFFPQILSGPINRSTHLLPQFLRPSYFDSERIVAGMQLMAWGFFKKMVIADRLGVYVDQVYDDPTGVGGLPIFVATVLYAFQVYCDFSGYTDIAIGTAQILGYEMMVNFRQPYLAASTQEFWRRWHISLSTWFRDYVYISLGGNRVSAWRRYLNLFVVFVLSGLWHGASWTFVIWGALHGLYLVVGVATRDAREAWAQRNGLAAMPRLRYALQLLITFALVDFAWIFFRAATFEDALYVITHMFRGWDLSAGISLGLGTYEMTLVLVAIAILLIVDWLQSRTPLRPVIAELPTWARWSLYYGVVMCVLLLGKTGGGKFIYFQF